MDYNKGGESNWTCPNCGALNKRSISRALDKCDKCEQELETDSVHISIVKTASILALIIGFIVVLVYRIFWRR